MEKVELKEVKCDGCSRHADAVSFCYECSKCICTQCTDAHKNMYLLSSHNVVTVDSLRSTISNDTRERSDMVTKLSQDLKSAVSSLQSSDRELSDHEAATNKAIDNRLDSVIAKAEEKRRELKQRVSRIVSEARKKVTTQRKNAERAVGEVENLAELMNRTLEDVERATDQKLLSLEKQVERVSQLYSNPADKFPEPTLPELVVHCGGAVEEAIESKISISDKGSKSSYSPVDLNFY